MADTGRILQQAVDMYSDRISPRDPVEWAKDKAGIELWSKQQEIVQSVRDHKKTAVQSGHGVGKSEVAAIIAAWWIDIHPPGEGAIVTTAPTVHQVSAVLWEYIRRIHKKGELPGRVKQTDQWDIGGQLVGYGRKPQDYSQSAFQGFHRPYTLIILDEAGGVPKWLWDAADSLATGRNCKILAIGNPDDPSSHFKDVCQPTSNWNNIKISVFDSPNFTGEPVSQKVADVLTSEEWVEDKRTSWGENTPLWTAKVLGEFPELDEFSVIPLSWVRAAQNRWLDWKAAHETTLDKGDLILGVDVATTGTDKSVIAYRRGEVVYRMEGLVGMDTQLMAETVSARMDNDTLAVVDVIGIGAGVVDKLKRLKRKTYGFNAGARTHLKDISGELGFPTIRSAAWWGLRQKLDPSREPTLCLPDDEQLAADLTAPRWGSIVGGKVYVESKEDIRRRIGRSTDYADAVVQALWMSGNQYKSIDESSFYWSDALDADGAIPWEGMEDFSWQ